MYTTKTNSYHLIVSKINWNVLKLNHMLVLFEICVITWMVVKFKNQKTCRLRFFFLNFSLKQKFHSNFTSLSDLYNTKRLPYGNILFCSKIAFISGFEQPPRVFRAWEARCFRDIWLYGVKNKMSKNVLSSEFYNRYALFIAPL